MLRQYMVATGALAEQETLVDYYTHIKGAEYIIAVAFLGLFPVFYKYRQPDQGPDQGLKVESHHAVRPGKSGGSRAVFTFTARTAGFMCGADESYLNIICGLWLDVF